MGTYQNPVYPHYFADPFVWEHEGKYFAVGTGPVTPVTHATDKDLKPQKLGSHHFAFPLLTSNDLCHWELHGGGLKVPDWAATGEFWAPEVAYADGTFYMYYSVATRGLEHGLRVAAASQPTGPFEDVGPLLSPKAYDCPFAIDAHPFRDTDGQWYLFYSTDFLDVSQGKRAGTGLVVERLVNMTQLAGDRQIVMRANADWHLFKAQREMYGQVYDWHTLEGPCVRKHNGLYYCFYSGGCYEGQGYGVDYGVADNIMGPYSNEGCSMGARVLRTVPGKVLGPGHHSIVRGPDRETEYIVYHAWDVGMTARRMCIDKLYWTPNGPRCAGPTWTPQPTPGVTAALPG